MTIDRYQIQRELGKGGMGVVYLAYDPKLLREVAVKVIRTDQAADSPDVDQLRSRFELEAKAAAMLQHPGIITARRPVSAPGVGCKGSS